MKRLLILLFILVTFTIEGRSLIDKSGIQQFTKIEGLSHHTIFDIEQGLDGFIWIATREGLNRYDGSDCKIYYSDTTSNSLPSDEIRSLCVTGSGKLFIGTRDGLCSFNPDFDNFLRIDYEGKSLGRIFDILELKTGKIIVTSQTGMYLLSDSGELTERLFIENNVLGMAEDAEGIIWGFNRGALFSFNHRGEILKTYYVEEGKLSNCIPSSISAILVDAKNRLWIGTFRDGPLIFDPEKGEFSRIAIKNPTEAAHPMFFIHDMEETPDGKYWIGTEKGLFIYDLENSDYECYKESFDSNTTSLNDNVIYKIFRSRENIMWLGTYFGGLNFNHPGSTGFEKIKPGNDPGDLQGKALSQIIMGRNNELWIATEDAGIAIFDPEKKTFRHFLNRQKMNNVHALAFDREGNLWSGHFLGGINKINTSTYKIQNFSHIPGQPQSLINNFVFSLYFDPSGLLWVGTMNGVDVFDPKTNRFSRFKPEVFRGKFIYDIFQDEQNNFWFCVFDNWGLFRYNPETDSIQHFHVNNTKEIHHNSFISHCIDSQGKLWFGSNGGGLVFFDPETQAFKTYDMDDGFPNNVIYGILEDHHNNLWISTNKGISKFNYKNGEINNYNVKQGLVGNQFNYKSFFKSPDGTMYFGAINGLSYFRPDNIKNFQSKPEVHFTTFSLFNEPLEPGENSVLEKDIDRTPKITLKHKQNIITFDFLALDFHSGGDNNYFHYLEGFEPGWQSTGNKHTVSYTNLPAGKYTFHVKATDIYNTPNEKERNILITVLPSFWKSSWAYLIYTLLISGIILILVRLFHSRQQEKMTLKIEKIEKEKLQELHQHKVNFFTYISHEFKTPLTIILATLDSINSSYRIPAVFNNLHNTVKHNIFRLQFLINQLMEFSKVETDHALINLKYGDVVSFLKELFEAFIPLFQKKELNYFYIPCQDHLNIPFDSDKLEKIVSNLLTNAIKFTSEQGEIKLEIDIVHDDDQPYLSLTVSNTGKGLTKEQIGKVFNLFYKSEDQQNEFQGSGIGLTLTQSLVRFLKGKISVKSKPGVSTSFNVQLPYDVKEVASKPETIPVNKSIIENLLFQSSLKNIESEPEIESKKSNSDFRILFVEDNQELLQLLFNHYRKQYKVSKACNGIEAFNLVKNTIPDLIVTDLMMPEMDGASLCQKLKTSVEYSHIPIIMLTAKSDVETRIESLEVGVDIYLPKPFLFSELELHIQNILSLRNNLKMHFFHFSLIDTEHPVNNKELNFIEKIMACVIGHLDDPDFGVPQLTQEIGIGRTQLHMKLKQILNLSTTEFINVVRVREAQKLLNAGTELTISEISYKVGFNDPNYFSRTFRKILNISPSDYKNGGNSNDNITSARDQVQVLGDGH